MAIFETPGDYELMLSVLAEAHERVAMRTIGYCIMPSHWHLVLWPRGDGELSEFMRWLTVTHTQRWHSAHGTAGTGHVYQGRYKNFPVQQTRPRAAQRLHGLLEGGDSVLSVLRYVERNPLRVGLVTRAEAWPHSSLHARASDAPSQAVELTDPPGGLPSDWPTLVNEPQTQKELDALQRCIQRGRPLGREPWVRQMARHWGLQSTLRPRGRPKKQEKGS